MQLALEAQDREREVVARLLQELTPDVLSTDELSLGFKRLLASAEVGPDPLIALLCIGEVVKILGQHQFPPILGPISADV